MTRQIKFRGRRTDNGEWVYGIPISTHIGTFIVTEENPHVCDQFGYMEIDEFAKVDPSTVGQFTGLKDCEGKDIYEGDIVKACSQGEHRICEVAWSDKTVSFFLRHSAGAWYLSGAWGNESCEVIGTIHEGKEESE